MRRMRRRSTAAAANSKLFCGTNGCPSFLEFDPDHRGRPPATSAGSSAGSTDPGAPHQTTARRGTTPALLPGRRCRVRRRATRDDRTARSRARHPDRCDRQRPTRSRPPRPTDGRRAAPLRRRPPAFGGAPRAAKASLLDGVPMPWMVKWAGPFPPYVESARRGARRPASTATTTSTCASATPARWPATVRRRRSPPSSGSCAAASPTCSRPRTPRGSATS